MVVQMVLAGLYWIAKMITARTPPAELMSSSVLVFTNEAMMIDPSDYMQDLTDAHSLCRVRTNI